MIARYGGAFGISVGLHAALALWLAWPIHLSGRPTRERAVEVVLLPPAEDSRFPGVKPVDRNDAALKLDTIPQDDRLAEADLRRIVDHVRVLFPFVTPGLALDTFFPATRSDGRLWFENPYAEAVHSKKSRPVPPDLSPAGVQLLVDRSWSRGQRWRSFGSIREIVDAYDANDSRVAALARQYGDQNALQPYADGSIRDLRLWAQLSLAADHVLFIGFIRSFAAAHPSTRVGTELLFLLETLAQANEDALAVLVETDQPGDLAWTRQANPRAFILARRIEQEYAHELARLGLTSRAAITAYYENVRLAILSGILATTPDGYRSNDARFLIGAIYWRQDRRDQALVAWRAMSGGSDDSYAPAISQIRAAVLPAAPDARNIDLILRNQHGRWLAFSDDRLRHFGYRFDLY